jgi:two-component sensor histidine kinase
VSTLRELVQQHSTLTEDDIEHLHRLAADWQLLADLSFADLLLWVSTTDAYLEPAYLCVAHIRPTTGPTAYLHDQVGRLLSVEASAHLVAAATAGRIWREGDPEWIDDIPARHEAIPVRNGEKVVAVLGRDTNLAATRAPSQLELAYLRSADDLCRMVAAGSFPPRQPVLADDTSMPRAGDGVIRVAPDGRVDYASPNAQSAYRRLGFSGDLQGMELGPLTSDLADDPLEGAEANERISAALAGASPDRIEVEARSAVILLRALPLRPDGENIGALVLACEVTEVRRRDRALLTKDATIREIHHRVKNNLQTVAALLRLQSRRVTSQEAKSALQESVRRVSSIALVHETLSLSLDETVDFDSIVSKISSMVGEVAGTETVVHLRKEGVFGVLPSPVATPLAMVVTELLQNALEHAYLPGQSGNVTLIAERDRDTLRVQVVDSGQGLPDGFSLQASTRLGLQIVRTLVTSELGGSIDLRPRFGGGTEAIVVVPLTSRAAKTTGHAEVEVS